MNDHLRKRLVDGINVISNPAIIFGVIVLMLAFGWLRMGELTPLLGIIAGAYLLLALIGGQLAKCVDK